MGTQNQRYGSAGDIEIVRHNSQLKVDSLKDIEDRRKLGQFSTPYELALEIANYGLKLQKEEVQFVSWFLNYEVKALFKRNKLMTNHYEEYLRLQSWLKGSRAAKKYARKSIKLKG